MDIAADETQVLDTGTIHGFEARARVIRKTRFATLRLLRRYMVTSNIVLLVEVPLLYTLRTPTHTKE